MATTKEWSETGSFPAHSSNGDGITIKELTEITRWNDSDGGGTSAGLRDHRTEDGQTVTRLRKGVYLVNGVQYTSDHPDAR